MRNEFCKESFSLLLSTESKDIDFVFGISDYFDLSSDRSGNP
jgi:hypothetical protein